MPWTALSGLMQQSPELFGLLPGLAGVMVTHVMLARVGGPDNGTLLIEVLCPVSRR